MNGQFDDVVIFILTNKYPAIFRVQTGEMLHRKSRSGHYTLSNVQSGVYDR